MTSLTRGQNISITIKAERHKAMKTKYKEVKRLEEIKNHFWYDDDWRASITMLGGFHQGEPNREPNTEKDIRGPVSKDINFNPLDLIEAIRDKNENPDDIFHQMLLLSAETIGEIDRDTRESEKFKNRYKAIEKDLWDEMIQLLREEQDELYRNVELAFGVCLIEDEGLLDVLFNKLERSSRSIEALRNIVAFSYKNSEILINSTDIILKFLVVLNDDIRGRAIRLLGEMSVESQEVAKLILEKASFELVELLVNENHFVSSCAASALGKIANVLPDESEYIIKKATEILVELLDDKTRPVHVNATVFLGEIASSSMKAAIIIAENATDKLVELLKSRWTNKRAAYTLGQIAGSSQELTMVVAEKATVEIVELLNNKDWAIRKIGIDSINEIVLNSPGAARIITEKAIDKLIELLDNSNWTVRENAVDALRKIMTGKTIISNSKIEEVTNRLVELLNEEENEWVLKMTAYSLGKIAIKSAKAATIMQKSADKILKFMVGGDGLVVLKVAVALRRINKNSPEANKKIHEYLDVIIEFVRKNIIQAGYRNEHNLIDYDLIDFLYGLEKVANFSPEAKKIIIGKRSIIAGLLGLEENQNLLYYKATQSRADLRLLGKTADVLRIISSDSSKEFGKLIKLFLELILKILMFEGGMVRKSAVDALVTIAKYSKKEAKIIMEIATEKLIMLLDDNDSDIRKNVVKALEYIMKNNNARVIKILPSSRDFLDKNKISIFKRFLYKENHCAIIY